MSHKTAALLVLFCLLPLTAAAQDESIETTIDRKVDELLESKQTRYRREQIEADQRQRLEEEIRRQEEELRQYQAEIERRKSGGAVPGTGQTSSGRPPVEFYTITNCKDCRRMEQFLQQAGVSYTRYDVERDPFAEKKYVAVVGKGDLPVTRINGRIVRGYQPEQVRRLIQGSLNKRSVRRSDGISPLGAVQPPSSNSQLPPAVLPEPAQSLP